MSECSSWFGVPAHECDVPHWIPYLDADVLGIEPARKITLPLPAQRGGDLCEAA